MRAGRPNDGVSSKDVLDIVAAEVGVSWEELVGDAEFADLGVDNLLSKSIRNRICQETRIELPTTIFEDYPTVESFLDYMQQHLKLTTNPILSSCTTTSIIPPASTHLYDDPISILLQGNPTASLKTIFLLPDGSGSGMAYVRLPAIHPSISLIALNSPFLSASSSQNFTVESISQIWTAEIRRRQPQGPYILGGWSAGGYYSYEVAKDLIRQGETVEKLILIDSPCRLEFEALPMEVVEYLSKKNLMGNWQSSQTPEWLVRHFDISIRAIENYIPAPISPASRFPEVFVIWAEDGVLMDGHAATDTGLDLDVKVTRFLIKQREGFGPHGWDRLFPGGKVSISKMPGNHFTLVHPPNCSVLSTLLRETIQDSPSELKGNWRTIRPGSA